MNRETLVVTGISSMLGAFLARGFCARGWRVLGTLTRPVAEYDPLRSQRISEAVRTGVEVCRLDVTAGAAVQEFVAGTKPAVWLQHAGWAADYGSLTYDLDRGHAVNVAPLRPLYEALTKHGCRGIILTGSSMEYSDSAAPAHEEDACWPTTPYGLSKLVATVRVRQLAHEFGLTTRVARIFIPYGSLDQPQRLLPSVVTALRSGQPVDLSPCTHYRDFLHVEDIVRGYEALAEDLPRPEQFDLFNLCSGQATQLRQLLLEMASLLQADPALLRFGRRALRPGEPPFSCGANDKARRLLGWEPRPLQQGLQAYLGI